MSSNALHSITLVGLGNIGSQLLPLLLRLPNIERLVLVDPDSYGSENRMTQNIAIADLGELKVAIAARQAKSIRPEIHVESFAERVEDVPVARLRCDVLVGCVDSRVARQTLNRVAVRMAMPWIDGAVEGAAGLARVAAYAPCGACMECRWSDEDYRLLESVYTCRGNEVSASGGSPSITNAPAELGALTACLQILSLRELLAGQAGWTSHEAYFSTGQRSLRTSRFNLNDRCLLDHSPVQVSAVVDDRTRIADALRAHGVSGIGLEGHVFITELGCSVCGTQAPVSPYLARGAEPGSCAVCGNRRQPIGLGIRETLGFAHVTKQNFQEVGFLRGDIVGLVQHGSIKKYIELGVEGD